MSNVIILTSGLSGSSVLSNLISQAGYWVGDDTCKKKDYDTYENAKLVSLNQQLIELSGYRGSYTQGYDTVAIDRIKALDIDTAPYQAFIKDCENHSPWIWKDPRLWVTFDFWAPLLKEADIKVVFLDRGMLQRWISVNIRRQIQSYAYTKYYTSSINNKIKDVIQRNDIDSCDINFDDLLLTPEKVLETLSQFLNINLDIDDLSRVYNKRLYKKARGWGDLVLAILIFVKNYQHRIQKLS